MVQKWYVVFDGRVPGIYQTWADCSEQVMGYSNALHKSYHTLVEADTAYRLYCSRKLSCHRQIGYLSQHTKSTQVNNSAVPNSSVGPLLLPSREESSVADSAQEDDNNKEGSDGTNVTRKKSCPGLCRNYCGVILVASIFFIIGIVFDRVISAK